MSKIITNKRIESVSYKKKFYKILNHEKGKNFLLDYGGDQSAISIFVYYDFLKRLGIDKIPRINSLVQMTALPENEFLKKYNIGFRWLYPKPSKKTIKLNELFKKTIDIDIRGEIERGYVSGGVGNFFIDEWGIKWKRSAYYFEMVEHPLAGKTLEEIKKYKFPDPADKSRVENLNKDLKKYYEDNPNYIIALSQSYGGLLETALWLRGFMDFFIDIGSSSKECSYLLDKIMEYFMEWNRNYIFSVEGKVDIMAIGDDYGMQDRMILSPGIWRKYIKSRYKKEIEDIKSKYNHIKWFHHSCGSIFPIINDLIDIGVDILNPIQPKAKDMEPKHLKNNFGDRITFHGGIDIQELLPFGTPIDVEKEVKRRLDILSENGGYIIAPSHNIQAKTPIENILTFYNTVNEYYEESL